MVFSPSCDAGRCARRFRRQGNQGSRATAARDLGADAVKGSLVKKQRRVGRRASEGLHLTDVKNVVSTVVSGPRRACEAGQSAADGGGDTVGHPFDAYVGLWLSRKVQRQLMFGLAEDGHRERPASKNAACLAPAIQ